MLGFLNFNININITNTHTHTNTSNCCQAAVDDLAQLRQKPGSTYCACSMLQHQHHQRQHQQLVPKSCRRLCPVTTKTGLKYKVGFKQKQKQPRKQTKNWIQTYIFGCQTLTSSFFNSCYHDKHDGTLIQVVCPPNNLGLALTGCNPFETFFET